MGKLQSIFGKANFQVVDNSKHLQPEEAEKKFNMLVKKGIDKFMKKPIQSKIAKDWVKKQRELKKRGIKESTLMSENPAAIAAAQRMVVQNKAGKKVSVMTAKNTSYKDKDPSAHRKAKSIFQRIVDKFKKKKEVKEVSLKKLENAIMALKKKTASL
jgi:F0F1-type ATP synthase alpha subunit